MVFTVQDLLFFLNFFHNIIIGLLSQLTGLNLTNNPLEFPPKDIIESGTKVSVNDQFKISIFPLKEN